MKTLLSYIKKTQKLFLPLTASRYLQNITEDLLELTNLIGVALLAWGLGKLVLSMKDDNPESKTKAIIFVFASIFLLSLNVILGDFGLM